MIGVSAVATPSESNSLDPVSPTLTGLSHIFSHSGNIFFPSESSMNEFFCCNEYPPRAFSTGVTSLDATSLSMTIEYFPLSILTGPICDIARLNAISPQSLIFRSLSIGVASHQ